MCFCSNAEIFLKFFVILLIKCGFKESFSLFQLVKYIMKILDNLHFETLMLCLYIFMYRNHSTTGDTAAHATRFIALAKVGNAAKEKWLYALNIEPIDQMKASDLYQATTDQTECPYSGNLLLPTTVGKQVCRNI